MISGYHEQGKADKRTVIDFFLAVACLFAGSLIYLLFRPTSLLMFHWADQLGVTELIVSLRKDVHFSDGINAWVVYSLPFSLWLVSGLFFVNGVWGKSNTKGRIFWFWSIPVLSILSELAQNLRLLPGRFDPVDLVSIIIATIFGVFATQVDINSINKDSISS